MADSLRCEELAPKLWPAFERLFGANGACGGCVETKAPSPCIRDGGSRRV
jgi:hypothetical protein